MHGVDKCSSDSHVIYIYIYIYIFIYSFIVYPGCLRCAAESGRVEGRRPAAQAPAVVVVVVVVVVVIVVTVIIVILVIK